MEQGEAVSEAFVKRYNHISLVRVDVFEALDANLQTEETGSQPSPPTLSDPADRPTADRDHICHNRGETKDESCRTEEDEDGCPDPEPLTGRVDCDKAAEKSA